MRHCASDTYLYQSDSIYAQSIHLLIQLVIHTRCMPRFAFTLSEKQKNWIESKAAERDVSQGEIIRRVIKSAMNDTDTDSLTDTDWLSDTVTDTVGVSQDEFEQLQKRVSQLEADIDTLDHDNQNSSSTTTKGTNPTDSESLQEFVVNRTEWTDSRREEVIDARVTVLEYLQNEANSKDERVPTRRLFEVCKNRDATVTNQTVDPEASNLNQSVFYEKTLKPILDDASDAGMVTRLQGGDYGWYWDN